MSIPTWLRMCFLRCIVLVLLAIGATLGGSVAHAQVAGGRLILPSGGLVAISVSNATSNMCSGNLLMRAPESKTLFTGYNDHRGGTLIVGPYAAGTEIVLEIAPAGDCAGFRYANTDPVQARVYTISSGIWRVEWEDLPQSASPDFDYDDLIVSIRLTDAYPDFKQNDPTWSDSAYGKYTDAYYSIGRFGSALTALSNLLSYHGARDLNPNTLNTWMKNNGGYDEMGGTLWAAPARFRPAQSEVPVMEYKGAITATTRAAFDTEVAALLAKNWPVILQIKTPRTAAGSHYVVATRIVTENGQRLYAVRDTLGTGGGYTEITRLAVSDPGILRAFRYVPSDGVSLPSLVIKGLSATTLLLTDAEGRRTGFDALSNAFLSEIPGSVAYADDPYWLLDQAGNTKEIGKSVVIEVLQPAFGDYSLDAMAAASGAYTVEAFYDDGVLSSKRAAVSDTAVAGQSVLYDLTLAAGGTLTLEPHGELTLKVGATNLPAGEPVHVTAEYRDSTGAPLAGRTVRFTASRGFISGGLTTDSAGRVTAMLWAPTTAGPLRVQVVSERGTAFVNLNVVGTTSVTSGQLYLPLVSGPQPARASADGPVAP